MDSLNTFNGLAGIRTRVIGSEGQQDVLATSQAQMENALLDINNLYSMGSGSSRPF